VSQDLNFARLILAGMNLGLRPASVLSHVIIYDTTVIPRTDDFCRPEESALTSPESRFLAEFTSGRARFLALLGMTRCSGIGMTERGTKCKELNGTVLAQGFVNFMHPIRALQNLAGLGAIGSADDSVTLHQVKQAGGAAISQPQAALQE